MKLKQLIIDNIASIEHAEINFDAAPLAGERLFLITGETGSGKSTVIDCLCLALYGNTPRLSDAKGAEYTNSRLDGSKDDIIQTNNVRQLLRRGAVSASIRLTFDDRQGIPYIATWGVHRARNKVDGAIQPVERTLMTEDGINPPVNLTKTKEITNHVTQLIGLDIDQFFRTVVLAQGKFAEFLNSGENEKSNLLKKMTGTEIFTDIGAKIYEVFLEKENIRNNLREHIQGITLLDDDEKSQINEQMAAHTLEQETMFAQSELAKKMTQWLDDKAQNERELTDKRKDLTEKETLKQEEEYMKEQQLVDDWEATVSARRELRDREQAQHQIQLLQNGKPSLQDKFDQLCAALRATVANLNTQRDQLHDLERFLEHEAPNREMYKGIKSIKALLKRLQDEQKNVGAFTLALHQELERKPITEENVHTSLEAQQRQENEIKQLEAQYEAMNVRGINDKKDALSDARQTLNLLKSSNDAVEQSAKALSSQEEPLAIERQTLEKAQAAHDDKLTIMEQARVAVERENDMKNLLEQVHKSLHKGDTCPICGNIIDQLQDNAGDHVLEGLREQLKRAEDDLKKNETDIAASGKTIKQLEQQMLQTKADLNQKAAAREGQMEAAMQQLERCGKHADLLTDNTRIDALIATIEQEAALLSSSLQQAEALNSRISDERKKLATLTEEHNQAVITHNKVLDSIRHQQEAITRSSEHVESLTRELNAQFTIEDWQDRAANEVEFITGLERKSIEYQNRETQAQQLKESISKTEVLIPAMQDNKRNIVGFTDNGTSCDQVPDKLDERWRQFENKCINWNNQLDNERNKAQNAQKTLDEFLNEHPNIGLERITALRQYQQGEIDIIKNSHKRLTDSITHLQGEISSLAKRQQEILGNKPDCPEVDRDKLDQIYQSSQARYKELTTLIAELKARLNTDEANKKTLGEKMAELEKAELEFNQWAEFNNMLGDSTGNKFSRIAQSYILGELLNSANGYLRQFNNRYELEANPGTLVILVRDLLQGDLTSVNTLSGGESFMVSLALALALSSATGKLFSVDTLFIDEGFGSLSPNYLDNVMETLNRLYDIGGKRVGIISHVEMLKERVTTQVQVYRDPKDNTVSRIQVVS